MSWYSNAGTSVCHTGTKVTQAGSFMEPRESSGVVFTLVGIVGEDVFVVPLSKLLHSLFDISVSRRRNIGFN